jgi:hypothetical protein
MKDVNGKDIDLANIKNISKCAGWGTLSSYIEVKKEAVFNNLRNKEYTRISEIEADRRELKVYEQITNLIAKKTDK